MAEQLDCVNVAEICRAIAKCAITGRTGNFTQFASADEQARLYRTADLWDKIQRGEVRLELRV